MKCNDCQGSGACDPCDGYGTTSDTYPNAGDGRECEICDGAGICPGCLGTGTTDNDDETGDVEYLSACGCPVQYVIDLGHQEGCEEQHNVKVSAR